MSDRAGMPARYDIDMAREWDEESPIRPWDPELQKEIDALMAEIDLAEQDVVADMGEEALDAGAWIDVTRSIVGMSDASEDAKREVLRMKGLTWREDR